METRDLLLDTLGFGAALWLAGYLASILLFFVLPPGVLGWVLFAVFTPATIYAAYWRFHKKRLAMAYFLCVAAAWTAIAVVFDYIFIVAMFKPANYYPLDVLLYYAATLLIPIGMGLKYSKRAE